MSKKNVSPRSVRPAFPLSIVDLGRGVPATAHACAFSRDDEGALMRRVLLTGATGFLGRYLLRELLAAGKQVTVLARAGRDGSAEDRVAALTDACSTELGRRLPRPVVISAELGFDELSLGRADRHWVSRRCQAVLHAAAYVGFRATHGGEPWRTNIGGTQSLVRLALDLGIRAWHQVSTAFVCGDRAGPIREDELACGQRFRNPYEESKFEAESLLRGTTGLCTTVYRPTVILGDSKTGFASTFTGLYRLFEMADRLAPAAPDGARRPFPLRLPLAGEVCGNFVTVDWVARAIAMLLDRPGAAGGTYHLVSRTPTPARLIRDTAATLLRLDGVELVGPHETAKANRLDEMFRAGLRDYWPYLAGTPTFCDRHTAAALPDLPPPAVDARLLTRLMGRAQADDWGRRDRRSGFLAADVFSCARYVEEVFPEQARRTELARAVKLDLLIGLQVDGPGGGCWSCRWQRGELRYVRRGGDVNAAVVYRTDVATLRAIVEQRETPQDAFFDQRMSITGDLETGLKLAALFSRFLRDRSFETRYRGTPHACTF
jgi:thioester reductase-like protein